MAILVRLAGWGGAAIGLVPARRAQGCDELSSADATAHRHASLDVRDRRRWFRRRTAPQARGSD